MTDTDFDNYKEITKMLLNRLDTQHELVYCDNVDCNDDVHKAANIIAINVSNNILPVLKLDNKLV